MKRLIFVIVLFCLISCLSKKKNTIVFNDNNQHTFTLCNMCGDDRYDYQRKLDYKLTKSTYRFIPSDKKFYDILLETVKCDYKEGESREQVIYSFNQ